MSIRQLQILIVAGLCLGLTSCGDDNTKSASVTPKEWKENVQPLRDQFSGGGAGNGGGIGGPAAEPTGTATLIGKFVFDANAAIPAQANITAGGQDAALCGQYGLKEEGLIVDPATRGVKNVVIYVRSRGYGDAAKFPETVELPEFASLSNENCRFEPHVQAFFWETTLNISNSDPTGHNSRCDAPGDAFNETVPQGRTVPISFSKSHRKPVKVSCGVHPWMNSYIFPADNPYVAVTGDDGTFRMENVPAGVEIEFQVWHEKSDYLEARSDWRTGRFKLTLENDEVHDLGQVTVSGPMFQN